MRYQKKGTGEIVEFDEPLVSFDVSTSWERLDDEEPAAGEKPLADLTRDDLNAIAADLGVENPEGLSNKGEVIEAIEAARVGGDDENE